MAVDDAYTTSLLHFDGDNGGTTFTDESGKTWTAVGNAQLDTAQKKFGTAGGLLDGASGISTPNHADLNFGSGDFSIDFWIRAAAAGQSNWSCIYEKFNVATSPASPVAIAIAPGTYNLKLDMSVTTPADLVNQATIGTLTQNVWAHIAICRSGEHTYAFFNGTLASTSEVGTASLLNAATPVLIGTGNYSDCYFNGHIDELRISKGIARWTADFTPPTAEYDPNIYIYPIPNIATVDTLNAPTINTMFPPTIATIDTFNAPSIERAIPAPTIATVDTFNAPSYKFSYAIPTIYTNYSFNTPSMSGAVINQSITFPNLSGRQMSLEFINTDTLGGSELYHIRLKAFKSSDRTDHYDDFPNMEGTHLGLEFIQSADEELVLGYASIGMLRRDE
jgi:hypothetical protein